MQPTATTPDSDPSQPFGEEDRTGALEARPARGALTKTSGFLEGFTHTLQPYIGCRFGCIYCYVAGSPVHRFHKPPMAWGDYVHPRSGIQMALARELNRAQTRGTLHQINIFMSSATDPYQGLERTWRLSRRCLEVMAQTCPGLLVIQTRSPLVCEDFERIAALGSNAWLSLTIETDREDVRRALTPRCPSIQRRLAVAEQARAAGLQVQIAVSPCLPFSGVAEFGDRLLAVADRIVVDTFTSGDGSQGTRTAAGDIPQHFHQLGWGDWRDETMPRALYAYLAAHAGERAGWSQQGFVSLTQQNRPSHPNAASTA